MLSTGTIDVQMDDLVTGIVGNQSTHGASFTSPEVQRVRIDHSQIGVSNAVSQQEALTMQLWLMLILKQQLLLLVPLKQAPYQ